MLIYVLLVFLLHIYHVCAINVLVIFSIPLGSHYMAVRPLFEELSNRGHNVTVMCNYPDEKPVNNLEYVDIKNENSTAATMFPIRYYETIDSRILHYYNVYRHIVLSTDGIKDDCLNIFLNKNAKTHLASGKKYDVIFVEQFMSDCGLVYAAAHYDAPIIGITSHMLLPWAYSRLGLPFTYASDSFYFSPSGQNPPLLRQLENIIGDVFFNGIGKWLIQRGIYEVFENHLPEFNFDIEEIARNRMKMFFSYQHFSLTGGRNLAPQLLEIGGIHVGKPNTLPKDINDFIESSKYGVIYFSLGSNLKITSMSEQKLEIFLRVFSKLPQNVIMKYENDTSPVNSEKILSRNWLPQLDILCHPNVIAFVSHGGMLGTSESVSCAVPMIAMPFFGDQFTNAAAIEEVGFGKMLYFADVDEERLEDAIKNVTSEKMQKRAKELSRLWYDRPMSVMDSAIYWTEYVARNPDSPPSLPNKNNSILGHVLLHGALLLFVCLIFILPLYIIFKLMKHLFSRTLKDVDSTKHKTE